MSSQSRCRPTARFWRVANSPISAASRATASPGSIPRPAWLIRLTRTRKVKSFPSRSRPTARFWQAAHFTSIGGQSRNRIARLDATTGLADSFDPDAGDDVLSIAVQGDGKILAGGTFTNIGGQSRNRIARFGTVCPPVITHSTSQAITTGNSASCNGGPPGFFHRDNSYWRAFNMATFTNSQRYNVTSVSFGIETANAAGTGTTQPVTVRLYTETLGLFPLGVRTQIGTATVNVADQIQTILTVPLVATVPAGATRADHGSLYPGWNSCGSRVPCRLKCRGGDGPGYISAAGCAILVPTLLTLSGSPNMHLVFNVNGSCGAAPTPTPPPTPTLTPTPTATATSTPTTTPTATAIPTTPTPTPTPTPTLTPTPTATAT